MSDREESSGGVVTEPLQDTKRKTSLPRMFKVLLHNDDFTTREFVIEVLRSVFHRSEVEAVAIMLKVHHSGVGVAGVYSKDVAETKALTVEHLARQNGFPLRLSIEPED
jgi:ATP-dependent Clp protease adaptor protein ClpS